MLGMASLYTNKNINVEKIWSLGFGVGSKGRGGGSWPGNPMASAQSQGQWEPWEVLEREP